MPTVLIVEDEGALLILAERMLQTAGYPLPDVLIFEGRRDSWGIFWSPRRQAAADHKRRNDGGKNCQLQIVGHAFSPSASQCRGPYFAMYD